MTPDSDIDTPLSTNQHIRNLLNWCEDNGVDLAEFDIRSPITSSEDLVLFYYGFGLPRCEKQNIKVRCLFGPLTESKTNDPELLFLTGTAVVKSLLGKTRVGLRGCLKDWEKEDGDDN